MCPENSRASAANFVGKCCVGMLTSGPTPLRPATNASHSAWRELPNGLTSPIPVMTTRRCEFDAIPPDLLQGFSQPPWGPGGTPTGRQDILL